MFKRCTAVMILICSLTSCATVAVSQAEKILNKKIISDNKIWGDKNLLDLFKYSSSHSDTLMMYSGVYASSDGSEHNFLAPVSHVSELSIDGKKLNLVLAEEIQQEMLSHSSLGIYRSQHDNAEHYVISIGQLTPKQEMPMSGQARYHGKALYRKGDVLAFSNGMAYFAVDFGDKTVKGEIHVVHHRIPLLEAEIHGNTFHAQHGKGAEKVWIRGNFFGEKAAELGGVWADERRGRGERAVFGAQKQ